MSSLIPVNEKIACEPPESVQMRVKVQGGFGRIEQKTQLTRLKVVFGNESLDGASVLVPTGAAVFVSGEAVAAHQWAKQVFTYNDGDKVLKFILVPLNLVLLVDRSGSLNTLETVEVESPVGSKPDHMIRVVD